MLVGFALTVCVELLNSEPKFRFPLINYLIKGAWGDKWVMVRCHVFLELQYWSIALGNRQCTNMWFGIR